MRILAPDPISQEELRIYYDIQTTAWSCDKTAHRAAADFERRIELGAAIEEGPLTFDGHRSMVRTKKLG